MPSCITCDYDLQGLPDSALCPECATPVARSIGDRRLRNADPRWLARTTRGIVWLERAIRLPVYTFLGLLAGVLLMGLLGAGGVATPIGILMAVLVAVGFAGIIAFILIYIPACFFATAPSDHFASPIQAWRLPIIVTSVAPVALVLTMLLGRAFGSMLLTLPFWTFDAVVSVLVLLFAVHEINLRAALRTLAQRTDAYTPKRAKRHRPATIHCVAVAGVILAFLWLPTLIAAGLLGTGRTPGAAMVFAGAPSGLAYLIIILEIASLNTPLKDTARALKEELRAASPQDASAQHPPPSPTGEYRSCAARSGEGTNPT